jgi:hypothetical protein
VAVGFKEIRYDLVAMTDQQFERYMDFLLATFERSCIIFNIRNARDVAKSGWWPSIPFARWVIRDCDSRFERTLQAHPAATIKVDYDSYRSDPAVLRALFDFLGADFDRDEVMRVLATPHSYHIRPERLEALLRSRSVAIWLLERVIQMLRRR